MGEAKRRGSFNERKIQAAKHIDPEKNHSGISALSNADSEISQQKASPIILQFIESIKLSISTRNYLSALMTALTLPDICSSLEDEERKTSSKKYTVWFRKYIEGFYQTYQGEGKDDYLWLSGEECYALRCTYLHKGTNNIEDERILKNYESSSKKIIFMAEMHSDNLQIYSTLILRLETFCDNIIRGVEQWLLDSKNNPMIMQRILEIPLIHTEGFSPMPGIHIEC